MVQFDSCPSLNKCDIFDHYSPEQFYFVNKLIIDWTKKHYNKENRYFFVNSWNNWHEGTYLEPDQKYGYASINSLSKAIFNLTYIEQYNLNYLNNESKIAVHIHLFYEDLINYLKIWENSHRLENGVEDGVSQKFTVNLFKK